MAEATASDRPARAAIRSEAGTGYLRERLQHVSWGAIFLGLVIALGIHILLSLLGIGIGFIIVNPSDPMGSIGSWSIGTGIYMVVVQMISLFIGGFAAARLAPALTDSSAVFHGLSIWALGLIAMVWLGTTTAGLAVSGVSNAVSGMASVTGRAVQTVVPDIGDIGLPEVNYQDLPEPLRETLRNNGITPENLQREVRAAFRDVVSQQEQQRLMNELRQTVREILQSPMDAPEKIDQAIDELFGRGGILSQEDMNELQRVLQNRLNLSEQDVQQITDRLRQAAEQVREQTKELVRTAKQEAVQAADAITQKIGTVALWIFVASVLGLIAAVAGGKRGEV